jgi:hypothetical protein
LYATTAAKKPLSQAYKRSGGDRVTAEHAALGAMVAASAVVRL